MLKAESSILIHRPIEDVFKYIADDFFENFRKWDAAVLKLEKTSPSPVGIDTTGWQVMKGDGWEAETDFRVTDYDPNRKFSITGTGKPYFKNSYTFEPIDDGTKIFYASEFSLDGIAKLFEPLMKGAIKKASQEYVDNLKQLLEDSVL
jgi:carbon monoxide dehydrogenase subunit G